MFFTISIILILSSPTYAITHRMHDIYHFRGKESDKKKHQFFIMAHCISRENYLFIFVMN